MPEYFDSHRKEISNWLIYGSGSGSAQTLLELGLLSEEEYVKWVEALGAAAGFDSEQREATWQSAAEIVADDDPSNPAD